MMRRKMRIMAALLAMALLIGGAVAAHAEEEPTPAERVLAVVLEGQAFEEMTALSVKQIEKYLGVDMAWLSDMAMAMDASRATAEAVVVLHASDEEASRLLEEALLAYRDDTLLQYRDYQPAEVPKLEGAVLERNGLWVALVVSGDARAAKDALRAAWEAEDAAR